MKLRSAQLRARRSGAALVLFAWAGWVAPCEAGAAPVSHTVIVHDAPARADVRLRAALASFTERYDYVYAGKADSRGGFRYVARYTPFNLNSPARSYWQRPRAFDITQIGSGELRVTVYSPDRVRETDNPVINALTEVVRAQFGARRLEYR